MTLAETIRLDHADRRLLGAGMRKRTPDQVVGARLGWIRARKPA